MGQAIRRGIITSFNNANYTASLLIIEATNTYLTGVPVANHLDGTSALSGALCAVLFFDENNFTDAVVIATYPSTSQGIPTPPPGRVTLVAAFQQIHNQTITSGSTSTFTLTGGSSGIPTGALGALFRLTISGAAAGAFVLMGPHGSTLSNYVELDIGTTAGAFADTTGIIPVDTGGKVDIQANIANCTVNLFTFGYIL